MFDCVFLISPATISIRVLHLAAQQLTHTVTSQRFILPLYAVSPTYAAVYMTATMSPAHPLGS